MENNNFNDPNSNQNALFDLIQNIQSKLNDENIDDKKNNNTCDENTINNETESNNNEKNNSNNNFDFSSIISMFNNSDNTQNYSEENSGSNSNFNFDIGTILKLQKIFSSLNANDPKKNLLLSLKPFLRKSRQDKLNEYITILTIGNAIGMFNSRGDKNNE